MTNLFCFTSDDEETDESSIIMMSGFHPFSSLPAKKSLSSFTDLDRSLITEDSMLSEQLVYDFDWDMTDDTTLPMQLTHQEAQTQTTADSSAVGHSESNTNDNVGMPLLPTHGTAQLLSAVDDAETDVLDADLLQVCLAAAAAAADNNPTPSNTEALEISNASEVLDLFPNSVAPTYPTSSNIMAHDPSPLGIFIDQQKLNQQQFDQQDHQSMQQQQQQQQCSVPQREYQLKDDKPLPHFGSSQLHCGISTNEVGSNSVGQNIIPAHRYPTRLSIPTDEQFLDPVHNFLRSTCIEVFVSGSGSNLGGIGRGSKSNLVGLRCVHCKHVPKRERANQAVSYPSKTANICESVRNFQRTHLEACDYIPNEIKQKYRVLASQSYRRIPLKYVKVYVAEAACEIGMVQTPNGLIFGAPPNTSGKPSEKLQSIMSIAENPIAFKHLEDAIFPKVDDRLKKMKFSHIASEKTHQVIANCRKEKAAFVYPSDFPTLSDFCFVLYHQFVPCRPPSTALSRRKTKPAKWDTLSGLCCKYCGEAHPGERHHKGMYFPLDLQALHDSSSSFSHNVMVHTMTCQLVPLEIKEALEELQRLAAEHGVTTKRGTKQKFMKKLWERMANYYPAPSK